MEIMLFYKAEAKNRAANLFSVQGALLISYNNSLHMPVHTILIDVHANFICDKFYGLTDLVVNVLAPSELILRSLIIYMF